MCTQSELIKNGSNNEGKHFAMYALQCVSVDLFMFDSWYTSRYTTMNVYSLRRVCLAAGAIEALGEWHMLGNKVGRSFHCCGFSVWTLTKPNLKWLLFQA